MEVTEKESLICVLKPTLVIARGPDCSRVQEVGTEVRRSTQLFPTDKMVAAAQAEERWMDGIYWRKSNWTSVQLKVGMRGKRV